MEEEEDRGGRTRRARCHESRRGVPQGGGVLPKPLVDENKGILCNGTFPEPLGREERAVRVIQLGHMGSQPPLLPSHQNKFQMIKRVKPWEVRKKC